MSGYWEIPRNRGPLCPAGSLELGTYDLAAGRHRLRVTSVGKNPSSKGFAIGLDAIDLIALKEPFQRSTPSLP